MSLDLIHVNDLATATLDDSDQVIVGESNTFKKATVGALKNNILGSAPSYTTDTEPYLMRRTAHVGVVGKCALNKLVGGSLGWNQLNVNDRTSGSSNGITATKDSSGTWTLSGTATATALINPVTSSTFDLVANHVMYLGGCPSGGTTNTYQLDVRKSGVIVTGAIDVGNGNLFKVVESGAHSINMRVASGTTVNNIKYTPQLIDLTQMFGSTIADYAYSLGITNGIAWLRKYIDLGTYHAYDAGSIQSVQATAHVTTGFNQWDEVTETGGISSSTGENTTGNVLRTKNYIPLLPDTQYYIKVPSKHSASNVKTRFYDANKAFIGTTQASGASVSKNAIFTPPTNARFVRFQFDDNYGLTYTNDMCVNISKTTGTPKNGDYVPYNGHTYPLGSDTLRGIPQLVNNELQYDGDIKTPDGTITRKYGYVDLGSLTWTKENTTAGYRFSASFSLHKKTTAGTVPNMICGRYPTVTANNTYSGIYGISNNGTYSSITVCDTSFTDAAAFKTAMSGVYLVYELATPTTESGTAYQRIQTVDADGTESFATSSPVPVGHETQTPDNVLAALGWLGE